MKIERRKIDELQPDPDNARKHSDRNLQTIAASLSQFGQRRPVVVRSDNTILAGNGLTQAAELLGWDAVDVTVVPDDWSEEQARAYAIADNRTSDLAEWDEQQLIDSLNSLNDDELLAAAGFSENEYNDLLRAWTGSDGSTNPEDEWVGMPDYDQKDANSVAKVIVHFMTQEDCDAFFKMLDRPRAKYIYWPDAQGGNDTRQVDEWVLEQ